MPKRRLSLVLPVLIVVIGLPATVSWAYYKFTGDPTLRPLGVTLSSLRESEVAGFEAAMVVTIDWGRDARSPNTPREVEGALHRALKSYQIDYQIRRRSVAGDRIHVYFDAGPNRFGPYSLADVAAGIPVAVEAVQIAR